MHKTSPRVALVLSILVFACTKPKPVECAETADCDLNSDGACVRTPNGRRWCAYPDDGCPGTMLRYSDYDSESNVSGQCVDPKPLVLGKEPREGAQDVAITTLIQATLSEPLD